MTVCAPSSPLDVSGVPHTGEFNMFLGNILHLMRNTTRIYQFHLEATERALFKTWQISVPGRTTLKVVDAASIEYTSV